MATTSMVASLPTLTSLHSNRNRRWASVNIIKATASEKERSEGVKLSGGVGYLSKVILTSPHGSEAEIYLFGACLTSWKNPIGKDLLFVRPDAGSDGQKPISGGLPHCFSQFGPGKIRQHGFVRNTNWSLVESESVEGKPVVTFELKDAPYSCSMWDFSFQALYKKLGRVLMSQLIISLDQRELPRKCSAVKDRRNVWSLRGVTAFSSTVSWLISSQVAYSATEVQMNPIYEVGELFELGIQLSYLLLLLALLGAGTFFVIRQVLVRRELDLSAKELQEQVRSGDANATELFELGAVMLRRKFYPAATKFLLQAIDKWDGDDQDLAQVYNALGVSYVRDDKLEKGIGQFEYAVKLQPGYVTAWNNLGDAYEKKKDLTSALKAFEEVLLFDPNNKVARPRVDSLRDRINMYKGVPVKSKER